jgi:hypothetical protein
MALATGTRFGDYEILALNAHDEEIAQAQHHLVGSCERGGEVSHVLSLHPHPASIFAALR